MAELLRTAEDIAERIVLSTLPLINVRTCYALDEAEVVMYVYIKLSLLQLEAWIVGLRTLCTKKGLG